MRGRTRTGLGCGSREAPTSTGGDTIWEGPASGAGALAHAMAALRLSFAAASTRLHQDKMWDGRKRVDSVATGGTPQKVVAARGCEPGGGAHGPPFDGKGKVRRSADLPYATPRRFTTPPRLLFGAVRTAHANRQSVCSADPALWADPWCAMSSGVVRPAGGSPVRDADHVCRTLPYAKDLGRLHYPLRSV